MTRVVKSFAKPPKVIENGAIRNLGYGFLFAFHSNYGRIFSRFDTIYERDRHPATARQQKPRLSIASRGKNGEKGRFVFSEY